MSRSTCIGAGRRSFRLGEELLARSGWQEHHSATRVERSDGPDGVAWQASAVSTIVGRNVTYEKEIQFPFCQYANAVSYPCMQVPEAFGELTTVVHVSSSGSWHESPRREASTAQTPVPAG